MENFNLKKFLVENKLTTNSKMMNQFLKESTENEFPNSIRIKFTNDGYHQLFDYLKLYPYHPGGYNRRWKYNWNRKRYKNLEKSHGR